MALNVNFSKQLADGVMAWAAGKCKPPFTEGEHLSRDALLTVAGVCIWRAMKATGDDPAKYSDLFSCPPDELPIAFRGDLIAAVEWYMSMVDAVVMGEYDQSYEPVCSALVTCDPADGKPIATMTQGDKLGGKPENN